MNKNLKKVALLAVLFGLMVAMIPANIAWAGPYWQGGTLPTAGPSRTPTTIVQTTAAPQNTVPVPTSTPNPTSAATSIPNATATSTHLPGFIPSITPSHTVTATSNANPAATVLPASPSATIQATSTPADQSIASATLPPGFIPTQPTQSGSDFVPIITNGSAATPESNQGSNQPVSLILVVGIVLFIIIGAVLIRIFRVNRKL